MTTKDKIIKKENADIGQGLVQMYQAGFLDGALYIGKITHKCFKTDMKNKSMQENCKKAFEIRFVNKLQGKIKLKK